MSRPNRVQAKVLQAITNRAVEARKKLNANGMQELSEASTDSAWHRELHAYLELRRQLENAALAAGVPRAWIGQTRERGELGMVWRADIYWREPESIDRQRLLENLASDARQAREMAAVAAAYGEPGARGEAATARAFDRNLTAVTHRVGAIAHVLNLSTAEAERVWGGQESWIRTAAGVRNAGPGILRARWHEYARLDTAPAALQVAALEKAGIRGGTAHHSVSVTDMVQRFTYLLGEPVGSAEEAADRNHDVGVRRVVFSANDGAHITEAIDATGLRPENLRPVFRSAADPEPTRYPGLPETGPEP